MIDDIDALRAEVQRLRSREAALGELLSELRRRAQELADQAAAARGPESYERRIERCRECTRAADQLASVLEHGVFMPPL